MALEDPVAAVPHAAPLALRYGACSGPDNILWNDIIGQLLNHRSVRAYRHPPPCRSTSFPP
jgi:hypothetical protein